MPPLLWSYIQSNLVGDVALGELGTEETFTALGPWYEHVPDLEPADLHAAQLALRLGLLVPPDVVDAPDVEGEDPDVVSGDADVGPELEVTEAAPDGGGGQVTDAEPVGEVAPPVEASQGDEPPVDAAPRPAQSSGCVASTPQRRKRLNSRSATGATARRRALPSLSKFSN